MEKKYSMEEFKKMLDDIEMEVLLNPTDGLKGGEKLGEQEKLFFSACGATFLEQIKKKLFSKEK